MQAPKSSEIDFFAEKVMRTCFFVNLRHSIACRLQHRAPHMYLSTSPLLFCMPWTLSIHSTFQMYLGSGDSLAVSSSFYPQISLGSYASKLQNRKRCTRVSRRFTQGSAWPSGSRASKISFVRFVVASTRFLIHWTCTGSRIPCLGSWRTAKWNELPSLLLVSSQPQLVKKNSSTSLLTMAVQC